MRSHYEGVKVTKVQTPLLPVVRKFFEQDPLAAAHSLETMEEEEALTVLRALPPELSAYVFPYLQVTHAASFLKDLTPELFRAIVERLDPRQATTIFMSIPRQTREQFLNCLPNQTRQQLQELLTYPEDSAGRIMTTDMMAFHTDIKVRDAIQKIRALAIKSPTITYAYVVGDDNQLVGVLNMRDLLLATEDTPLHKVMRTDVFRVNGFLDREEVANILADRRYFAVPVVDSEQRLLGVVRAEDLLEDVQEEATEDLQRMVGAGGDEQPFSPVGYSLRKRLPWLYVNLATAFLAASVVGIFEDMIARITILAVFLPVVAGQGGNAGAQSLAVVLRGLVMREIPPNKVSRLIVKEMTIGVFNGLFIGVVTAAVVWLWNGNVALGLVIGLAMIVNMVAAGLAGAAIPLIMKAVGRDPAQSSSIILTTITDIIGFFAFLGFAVLFQQYLM